MRLTVIGSTGQTGRHVVAEAMSRGHAVTAATRRPEALEHRDAVTVVHADGRDPLAMRGAVSGADAVIAIVAARSPRGPHHMADVARSLVGAMSDAGVRRLVVTSAYPIVGDRPRVPMALLRLIFAANYADARAMEHVVTASDLQWTIARLNRLTNGPATRDTRLTTDLLGRPWAIPRADAAAVLVDLAEDGEYARTAVNVAGR